MKRICICSDVFCNTNQFCSSLSSNWVSNISIQFWHYLPGGSVRSHKLKELIRRRMPSLQMLVSNLEPLFLLADLLWIRSSYDPLNKFGNLLKWLTELRKPVYSFDHQFIIKDLEEYDQIERYIWWVHIQRNSVLLEFGVWLRGTWKCSASPAQKLSKPSPCGFFWRVHYIGTIDFIFGPKQLIWPLVPL